MPTTDTRNFILLPYCKMIDANLLVTDSVAELLDEIRTCCIRSCETQKTTALAMIVVVVAMAYGHCHCQSNGVRTVYCHVRSLAERHAHCKRQRRLKFTMTTLRLRLAF